MASKTDAAVEVARKAALGVPVSTEEAESAVLAAGEEVPTVVNVTFEHEDTTTRQHRWPTKAPSSLVNAEEQATKVKVEAVDEPKGTKSNDPGSNVMASGRKPFEEDSAVGTSGQVASPEEYQEDAPKKKSSSSK